MRLCLIVLLLALAPLTLAAPSVIDDRGNEVSLSAPAQRIVSLAPHTTELLFAAGAGDRVVGVSEYSNYPPAAATLPNLGSYQRVDLEQLLALRPDLVVVWGGGNGAPIIAKLRSLGLPLYVSDAEDLSAIASSIERLGQLAGTDSAANASAEAFRDRLARLRQHFASQPSYSIFYAIWDSPIMSVGADDLIAQIFPLCGARNIFADLSGKTPVVSREAVLVANPEVILVSGMQEERPDWLDHWRNWPQLSAVAHDRLLFIPPDLLQRPTPRLLEGAERLCVALEGFRQREARP